MKPFETFNPKMFFELDTSVIGNPPYDGVLGCAFGVDRMYMGQCTCGFCKDREKKQRILEVNEIIKNEYGEK